MTTANGSDGNGNSMNTSPRILSKEATDEILGENLALLIAVDKNGNAVRFLPHGSEPSLDISLPAGEETVSVVDISIEIPKSLSHMESVSNLNTLESAVCWCIVDGTRVRC